MQVHVCSRLRSSCTHIAFRDLGMFAISKSKYSHIMRSICTLRLLKTFDAFKEQNPLFPPSSLAYRISCATVTASTLWPVSWPNKNFSSRCFLFFIETSGLFRHFDGSALRLYFSSKDWKRRTCEDFLLIATMKKLVPVAYFRLAKEVFSLRNRFIRTIL